MEDGTAQQKLNYARQYCSRLTEAVHQCMSHYYPPDGTCWGLQTRLGHHAYIPTVRSIGILGRMNAPLLIWPVMHNLPAQGKAMLPLLVLA